MKKVYNNPTTEIIGLEATTYLCQATSQTPKLGISESTDNTETVY